MARTIFTGKGKLFWVADPTGAGTVVTLAAPTAVQINTGVDITRFLRRGSLATPQSGNLVDTSDAASRSNTTDLGTFGGDKLTANFYRDSIAANDTCWPLMAQGLRGFLAVFWFGTAGATPAAGDRLSLYQAAVNTRTPQMGAENDPLIFAVEWATPGTPNTDATLV
jgi:hypothetical protein